MLKAGNSGLMSVISVKHIWINSWKRLFLCDVQNTTIFIFAWPIFVYIYNRGYQHSFQGELSSQKLAYCSYFAKINKLLFFSQQSPHCTQSCQENKDCFYIVEVYHRCSINHHYIAWAKLHRSLRGLRFLECGRKQENWSLFIVPKKR